ncbi:MAG: hypothetical protein WD845_01525 [Pirellulales bacterium]
MQFTRSKLDWLSAAVVVVAFGGLFFGRMMIYPVATASGTFLERLAAQAVAWDHGHRVMLLGMVGLIPAALALRRAMHAKAPWLVDIATALTLVGAALGVGQFALDFAMLAAAQVDPPAAGEQFLAILRAQPFVQFAFYTLPDLGQLGLIFFTIALWRQGPRWRVAASIVTLAAIAFLLGDMVGALAVRVGLGLMFVGFSVVAWTMVRQPAVETTPI